MIGYLPTMYTAFSQREIGIALLDARAGSPRTAAEALRRMPVAAGEATPDAMFGDWERWSAQVLETHISYPLLGYYRSQHSNQSWLAALTTILDSCALIVAGAQGVRSDHAKVTFAMARHALVDVSQTFVTRPAARARDRLPAETLSRLREHLRQTPVQLPATREFEERLAALRLLYEPYAQALADYLLLELPPSARATPTWDRQKSISDRLIARAEVSSALACEPACRASTGCGSPR